MLPFSYDCGDTHFYQLKLHVKKLPTLDHNEKIFNAVDDLFVTNDAFNNGLNHSIEKKFFLFCHIFSAVLFWGIFLIFPHHLIKSCDHAFK